MQESMAEVPQSILVEYRLVYFIVTTLGACLALYLFDLYRGQGSEEERPAAGRRRRLSFSPEDLGGFSYGHLVLVSTLGLFLELLLIRWISSEISIFAYFKNFVLIACFLGFGLGAYLCRRPIHLLPTVAPLVAFCALIKLPWPALRGLIHDLPLYLGKFSEVQIWGVPAFDPEGSELAALAAAATLSIVIFGLLSLVFIPLGQLIGWSIENAKNGIAAYSANVLASLVGILLFVLLCFLDQPPITWFAVTGAMLVALFFKVKSLRIATAVAALVCLGLVAIDEDPEATEYWSPYQKLSLKPRVSEGEVVAYHLETNNSWFQQVVDLSPRFVDRHPELLRGVPIEWNGYNLPYRFSPDPPSVLVLGAGMGNDVAAALRGGAGRVVAVEIDPLIQKLGKKLHFEKPYDSPAVEVVIDDARSYVENSDEKFDLIVFSLLDSHTNTSHFSNIRIDNYVYTVEALERSRELLEPDGLLVVKFYVAIPWIAARLDALLEEVFGWEATELEADSYMSSGRFFFTGSRERLERLQANDDELRAFVESHRRNEEETARPTTDDWPYFYQREPGLPASVLLISTLLVLVCWGAIRRLGLRRGVSSWHFFFLGAAFLLLEVQLVSKMALLFGTTWIVNSVVIAGVLLLIFGANLLVSKWRQVSQRLAYVGLAGAFAVSWAVPLEILFVESVWLRAVLAGLVLCLPVFFAGIIFIRSFAEVGFSGTALGSNLMGSLVGGILESLSLWTGISSLLVLAALLYLASYLSRSAAGSR